ncbi:DMT family transporter [Bradyrhizobium prioriisuperbiae]|uniref:DMT family transporter n=1 Tax=Bradyrhizobium prioriisuperbiae TaxID=2854389 RepID=UPI0038993B83
MTALNDGRATSRNATNAAGSRGRGGLVFLLITSVGWGLNWPVMKHLLTEWPPLSARGLSGVVGGALLLIIAMVGGQSLRVPRDQWGRLLLSSLLNISSWMTLMGLALLWLPASEGAVIAYTMPVWASVLAWPILGERLTLLRVISLLLAFGGPLALMGGNGVAASMEKLPGIILAMAGAFLFALGTVVAKRLPVRLPAITSAAWQITVGCLPLVAAGLLLEDPQISALSAVGWASLVYMTLIVFCLSYVTWFAALARLPASVAAIGTLLVPVIGVVASAVFLHEPLGAGQITALVMTVAGVVLATRS